MEELLRQLLEQIRIQNTLIAEQSAMIAEKDAQIAALTAKVSELTTKIEELTHKKNSNNSSTPPSANRMDKPAPKSLREKSGRKPGGQQGHRGNGMKIDREPDEIRSHLPQQCKGCPRAGKCKFHCCDTRYEYEAIVTTKLIAHKAMGCTCPVSGIAVKGEFPSGITGTKQYGNGIFSLVNSLLTVGFMSVDRVQKLLNSLRIPISTGAIQNMLTRAATLAAAPAAKAKQRVTGGDVVNFDETGLRVAGKLSWLHCARKGSWFSYSVQEKRGCEGMDAMGILPEFKGVAVHDFWGPYQTYTEAEHAMCCAHLERELVYAAEMGQQAWAEKLRKLLQTMCHRKNELQAAGAAAFPEAELRRNLAEYDTLVAEGLETNPEPVRQPGQRGRLKKGKIRSLLERFRDFKAEILRFATDWRVPFTNNAAEQAIRCARVKEKVSGCFRTKAGADNFACLLSYLSTAVAHGLTSFDACLALANGSAMNLVGAWLD